MLPATTQYEKFEATFFNFDYPKNDFQLRRPVLEPPAGPLPEPEIHARLVAALGLLDEEVIEQLRRAAEVGPQASSLRSFAEATSDRPAARRGRAGGAVPDARHHAPARRSRSGRVVADGDPLRPATTLTASPAPASARDPTPVTVSSTPSWTARPGSCSPTTPGRSPGSASRPSDGLVHVDIPELLAELGELADETPPGDDLRWPLMLSAGERRSFTANTIFRDPAWRKKDPDGALRVSPVDAEQIGLADGAHGQALHEAGARHRHGRHRRRHATRPHLVAQRTRLGSRRVGDAGCTPGLAPNELTASEDRDPWAGTPWHKSVPARLEPV